VPASTSHVHVVIIGAGTGGLCLAHGLRRAGISVAVYERDTSRSRSEGLQGYRVGIDPDGSRALHTCLPPELFDILVATCARSPQYSNMLTEQLKEVLSTDGWGSKPADPVNSEKSVSRMTLRQVLLTGLDEVVHFGKTFTHYEIGDDRSVTAYFADGTSTSATVLVGADGTHSPVRRQYLPQARLQDTGMIAIGGKAPLTEETRALLTPKMRDGLSLIFAPKGYGSVIYIMEFPWDAAGAPKTGIGSTDDDLIARWPGLAFDNTRDYITVSFGGAAKRLPIGITDLKGPDLHTLLGELTSRWHPNLRKLISLADPDSFFPINIRTSVPLTQWETTTVTLIGDAIHTMTPGRGVGANTALRDARLLCGKLSAAHAGQLSLLAAIRDYETQMIDYGFDAVRKSRSQMTASNPIHTPIIGRALLAAMRTTMQIINHLPQVKNSMARAQRTDRGHDRENDT
jgi:2-polyprenyl-6-methoxyphenol hydroxylase-like FAD-dependent oxidoreductase